MKKRFVLGTDSICVTINGKVVTLHRIVAQKSFNTLKGKVNKGDVGGWVETEDNISQHSNVWVFGDAIVFGEAELIDSSIVFGSAVVGGDVTIMGESRVFGNALVYGDGLEILNSAIRGNAMVGGSYSIENLYIGGDMKIASDFIIATNNIREKLYDSINEHIPITRGLGVQINLAY